MSSVSKSKSSVLNFRGSNHFDHEEKDVKMGENSDKPKHMPCGTSKRCAAICRIVAMWQARRTLLYTFAQLVVCVHPRSSHFYCACYAWPSSCVCALHMDFIHELCSNIWYAYQIPFRTHNQICD